ncbi:hypothetical protein PIB30_038500 [Stylosanthes scabra]|uniref:Uncharacterized protein n=1 Tax=Stylosanthes scabra TaxID=79078 RepID=A0ABU6SEN3_9FABA|nr:hypothetical protein [Stylosanthes scabra]
MALELGRTPTQSEVFARTHTRKEDWLWVDKQSEDANDAFLAELKRLQEGRQAIIGTQEIYGMGVVPLHKDPPLVGDPGDNDTA